MKFTIDFLEEAEDYFCETNADKIEIAKMIQIDTIRKDIRKVVIVICLSYIADFVVRSFL